ncbi:MAG: hypothetical protein IPG06_13475 [Haliea sp.]|nr:hypothetical protein [Haliea sp.]
MTLRWPILLITAMSTALAGMVANGSYVVEADGANFSTESIADGADFDFVAQDFGIEATEAIQITLDNLSRATNLRGNLLLWSFTATGDPSGDDTEEEGISSVEPTAEEDGLSYAEPTDEEDGLSSAEPTGATALVAAVTPGSSEDYSYYDEGVAGVGQDGNGPGATDSGGGKDVGAVPAGEPLAASEQHLPAIDTNAIFWILKPAEFTSFSQMTAARFGFTVGHDHNSN